MRPHTTCRVSICLTGSIKYNFIIIYLRLWNLPSEGLCCYLWHISPYASWPVFIDLILYDAASGLLVCLWCWKWIITHMLQVIFCPYVTRELVPICVFYTVYGYIYKDDFLMSLIPSVKVLRHLSIFLANFHYLVFC